MPVVTDTDERALRIIRRFASMKSARSRYEQDWQDIRDLVRPNTADFNRMNYPGARKYDAIYDGTAPEANEQLAGGLMSFLTNPIDLWFKLWVTDPDSIANDIPAQRWLQLVTDILYASYNNEDTMFYTSLHEVYQDLGAFGTGVVNQEFEPKIKDVLFRADPLADCYVMENAIQRVDQLYKLVVMTADQIEEKFGWLPTKIKEVSAKDPDKQWRVIHAVYPRTSRASGTVSVTNMPFVSCWVCEDLKITLSEGGYEDFPYHVPRWVKLAGETYGRSPAQKCLPDIRMLNSMEKTLIKAGMKATDPPIVAPDDGFLGPLKMVPGWVNYKEVGTEEIQVIEHKGNLPWGEEKAEQKREKIREAFYTDWLRMEKENVEMTAFEVQDRREEKMRMIAPMLARQMGELLGPMIRLTYRLKLRAGQIPPAPASVIDKKLRLVYMSPAAKAQMGVNALAMARYINDLLPVAQADPSVFDVIDFDAFPREYAKYRGTPVTILRTPEAVKQIRAERAKMQQAKQLAEIAEPASKAVKNIADATKSNPQLKGALPALPLA